MHARVVTRAARVAPVFQIAPPGGIALCGTAAAPAGAAAVTEVDGRRPGCRGALRFAVGGGRWRRFKTRWFSLALCPAGSLVRVPYLFEGAFSQVLFLVAGEI